MKKNGFTLVEIIVVIAIVCVVSLVIVISYNKMIENQNQKSYQKIVTNIQAAAEVYSNINPEILTKIAECCSVEIPISTLVNEGLIKENTLFNIKKKDKSLIALTDTVSVEESCDGEIAYEFDGNLNEGVNFTCTNKYTELEGKYDELEQLVNNSNSSLTTITKKYTELEEKYDELEQLVNNNASSLPKGSIIVWSGSTIPSGWVLCNGSNGTPDLRDKFLVGSGSSYTTGATGGSATISIPSHTHTFSGTTSSASDYSYTNNNGGRSFSPAGHTHSFSGTTSSASGSSVSSLPPYYAVAYIMKK